MYYSQYYTALYNLVNFCILCPCFQGDENGIYEAVGTVGPVSICFDVTMGFQLYSHGVYSRLAGAPPPIRIVAVPLIQDNLK